MIKVAIVGCGRISKRHLELLHNNQIKNAKLVSVCDIVRSKAKKAGEKFKVPYYLDMEEMMKKENIDLVSVLTERNHAPNVINLSKYGKHILVEKPMALTLKDADEMIKSCDRNGCKLFVVAKTVECSSTKAKGSLE